MSSYHLDHLAYLETEAIHVLREVAAVRPRRRRWSKIWCCATRPARRTLPIYVRRAVVVASLVIC